jgi:hypothetical protein
MRRAAARPTKNPAKQPTRQQRSNSAASVSRTLARTNAPALKIATSVWPSALAASKTRSTSSGCVASQSIALTRPLSSSCRSADADRAAATTV